MESLIHLFPWLMGLTAAIVHVLSGPDHLAAVTPIVFDTKKKQWQIGFFWGTGHVMGMLLIGVLFYWFKEYIPVEKISEYGEQLVGVILIGIGLWAFYRIGHDKKHHVHPHKHKENDEEYVHIHSHEHSEEKHPSEHTHLHKKTARQNNMMALFVGIIHGFAGISHFLLMLPVLGYESKFESVQYIVGFGAGIIAAMVIYTVLIGKLNTMERFSNSKKLLGNLRFYGGVAAVVVGLFWLVSNG
jgi:ABC-type nickel/cobalt efflux system permease component RcnA